ncbi:uncharacterized protein LOC116307554 isoform X1 [Actinia tenebrosa]|uniref:Uncharacterized protein LOC116307554 isoform X1 n=1 Tax=Actinia tenebrosa TaxID=6105 RepID=A0A6P8J1C0_ACTTE|nr:uncharacterized protein LOC116307554 isoform X1 [Actinia tenebrosa]
MSNGAANTAAETQVAMTQNTSSDLEKTKPGKEAPVGINNLGNPVFSCPATTNATMKIEAPSVEEDCFQGYGSKPTNPMYLTSSMDYGNRSPTVHTMPTSFHAKCQKFSAHLGQCGMYRNYSLNTSLDKSIV